METPAVTPAEPVLVEDRTDQPTRRLRRGVPVYREGLDQLLEVSRRHLTPRRAATLGGFLVAYSGARAVSGLGARIDDLLYPEWEEQPVRAPVFIIGNPRSGTTFLHRLLSFDEEHFAGMKVYENALYAVSCRKAVDALAELDYAIPGAPMHRGRDFLNKLFFDGWDGIHKLGIDQYEEDEASFGLALNTVTVNLLMPFTDELSKLWWMERWDPEYVERFLDFYEAVIKRHLFSVGPEKRFLNKNVHMVPRVLPIARRFPDAKWLYNVRHPAEALPSYLNMWFEKWSSHSPELRKDGPEVRALAEMTVAYALRGMEVVDELGDQVKVVDYRELIGHPGDLVNECYEWLGLQVPDDFQAKLDAVTRVQGSYSSTHDYCLSHFGLERDWVEERFAPFIERFDL